MTTQRRKKHKWFNDEELAKLDAILDELREETRTLMELENSYGAPSPDQDDDELTLSADRISSGSPLF